MLLEEKERKRIAGTVINKFRGDVSILEPGLKMLEDRTDIPVLGVVPYFYLDLDEEDSLTERFHKKEKPGLVDIAVIRFPRISNFTDLAPLEAIKEVSVRYISSPADFGQPDLVILPGSKIRSVICCGCVRMVWRRKSFATVEMEGRFSVFAEAIRCSAGKYRIRTE